MAHYDAAHTGFVFNPALLRRVFDALPDSVLERAKTLGAWHPEHYIFPFRVKKGTYDVTRPASPYFIRSAFRSMREVTGLEWLQPRNFRNQVITKLFEAGTPDETIMSIAGHQSIKMSRYYSRIRITAKAEALNAICPTPRVGS